MTSPTRAERRQRTEERILTAARAAFAERGFERTTIRAVAAAAGIDPALVIQYFGSKQELFSHAVQQPPVVSPEGDLDALTEELMTRITMKIGPLPEATLAMMRSMLTYPEAADRARATLDAQVAELGKAIELDHPELRAALMMCSLLGVTIAHQLLDLTALRDVPADRIAATLRPALRELAGLKS